MSHGYLAVASVGSLSPNTFMHEGSTITVNTIVHNVPAVDDPYLALEMSQAPPSGYNFVLDVGSVSISFAGGKTSYSFYDTGVDWSMSAGETVTLRLRETPSENATLSGLVVNDDSMDLALSPAFASDITSYTAWVPMAVEKVTVTPTTLNPNSMIAWLDGNDMTLADADNMEAGHQVALAAGENVIQVKVTAQDGIATQTYTVTVTRAAVEPPAAPTGLSATAGNRRVALAWNVPASDSEITRHEYRYKTDGGYPDAWKAIPFSAPGGLNEDGFTVTKLTNDTAHTFQLRAVNAGGGSDSAESSAVTPSGSGYTVESIELRRDDNQDGEPYGIGDEIIFVVKFSHVVNCTDTPTATNVRFYLGGNLESAIDSSKLISKSLLHRYTVKEGDFDGDGIEIPAGPTALPDTYYQSASNNCSNPFDESGIQAQGPLPDRKVDGVYPSLNSAVVNGAELVLAWNETLRDDSVPAAGGLRGHRRRLQPECQQRGGRGQRGDAHARLGGDGGADRYRELHEGDEPPEGPGEQRRARADRRGGQEQQDRAGRADELLCLGGQRLRDARLGRAGVGRGHHAPRVPLQDGRELSRELDADSEQRAGRRERVEVQSDGAQQRYGVHLPGPRGERLGRGRRGRDGAGNAGAAPADPSADHELLSLAHHHNGGGS